MNKISKLLMWFFGIGVTLCLFAGAASLIGFVVAFCVGGNLAAEICVFIHKTYFPVIIRFTAVSAGVGLIGMYMRNLHALSVASKDDDKEKDTNTKESEQ